MRLWLLLGLLVLTIGLVVVGAFAFPPGGRLPEYRSRHREE